MSHIHVRRHNSSYPLCTGGSDQSGKRCVVRGIPRRESTRRFRMRDFEREVLNSTGLSGRRASSHKLWTRRFSTKEVTS